MKIASFTLFISNTPFWIWNQPEQSVCVNILMPLKRVCVENDVAGHLHICIDKRIKNGTDSSNWNQQNSVTEWRTDRNEARHHLRTILRNNTEKCTVVFHEYHLCETTVHCKGYQLDTTEQGNFFVVKEQFGWPFSREIFTLGGCACLYPAYWFGLLRVTTLKFPSFLLPYKPCSENHAAVICRASSRSMFISQKKGAS